MLPTLVDPRQQRPLLSRYGTELSRIVDRGQAEMATVQAGRLRRMDALMRTIVEQSFDGIIAFTDDHRVATANEAAGRIFAIDASGLLQMRFDDLFPDMGDLGDRGSGRSGRRLEGEGRRPDGSGFPVELSIRTARSDGERLHVVIVRDITRLKAQEESLRHQASHDALTGLPNRSLLADRLEQTLAAASLDGSPLALLLLDLDRFKQVNDTLGHLTGDLLLTRVARRLAGALPSGATIARLGGDEFAILLPPPSDRARAVAVAEGLGREVERPFEVADGIHLEVGVSVGIALFPDHAGSPEKLMQCADVAMYAAKNDGRVADVYDRGRDRNDLRQLTLSGALRQAIDGGELSFVYQPQLDLRSGTVASVEALVRWHHPKLGVIMPSEFVPQAECTGMIGALTRWSFVRAVEQLAAWREEGRRIGMAVNLSPRSLHEEELPSIVGGLLADWRVDPALLTIEITESAVVVDPESARRILGQLHDLGVRLSIDDFGTGYSSLSHLQRLPLDELKIDRSFVVNMTEVAQDLVIVRSTVQLAHNLGLSVVAEGLESERHLALLRDLGCDLGQGFHLCEPAPIHEIEAWFERMPWQIDCAA